MSKKTWDSKCTKCKLVYSFYIVIFVYHFVQEVKDLKKEIGDLKKADKIIKNRLNSQIESLEMTCGRQKDIITIWWDIHFIFYNV